MDVDLQDPPELILEMIAKWDEGWDVVYCVRRSRESDSALKRSTAKWFYRLYNAISPTPMPENVGEYRLMDRRVINVVNALPERNRFMKGLFAWVGFRAVAVEYDRAVRKRGTSKWHYWRLWNFALDGVTSFTTFPLRIWAYAGAAVSVLALLYALYIVVRTLLFGPDLNGYPSLIVAILFMGGVQLISLGVIGEYLGRIYQEVKLRPLYVVRDTRGF